MRIPTPSALHAKLWDSAGGPAQLGNVPPQRSSLTSLSSSWHSLLRWEATSSDAVHHKFRSARFRLLCLFQRRYEVPEWLLEEERAWRLHPAKTSLLHSAVKHFKAPWRFFGNEKLYLNSGTERHWCSTPCLYKTNVDVDARVQVVSNSACVQQWSGHSCPCITGTQLKNCSGSTWCVRALAPAMHTVIALSARLLYTFASYGRRTARLVRIDAGVEARAALRGRSKPNTCAPCHRNQLVTRSTYNVKRPRCLNDCRRQFLQ